MGNAGNDHTSVINWNVSGLESQEGYKEEKGIGENMYYPDSDTPKEQRRQKWASKRKKNRFDDDYVVERRVKKPRNKRIKYYDYEEFWE